MYLPDSILMVCTQVWKSGKSLEFEKHNSRLENVWKMSKIDAVS